MPKYLIDVNLPYYFNLWNTEEYIHQMDIDPRARDKEIWQYATKNNLIVITKDSDFSDRMLLSDPPPKVIHFRIGNMEMKKFYRTVNGCWSQVIEMIFTYKLVSVYQDRLEGIY